MTADEIRTVICESLARITGRSPDRIQGSSTYRDDLGLDSLSLLEMTVDLEYAFKVKFPLERLPEIQTIDDTIRLLQEYLPGTP